MAAVSAGTHQHSEPPPEYEYAVRYKDHLDEWFYLRCASEANARGMASLFREAEVVRKLVVDWEVVE